MPLLAVLRDNHGALIRGIDDPDGGRFDAADDLDALIPPQNHEKGGYLVLHCVDPNARMTLTGTHMPDLLHDLDLLRPNTRTQARGIARLRRLAETCRDEAGVSLWFERG